MRKTILLGIVCALLLLVIAPVSAQDAIKVYYAGPQGAVRNALTLAHDFVLVEDAQQADILVLNGVIPSAARQRYEAGAGLVLFLGPNLNPQSASDLLGIPVELTRKDDPISLIESPGSAKPENNSILWNSAPQIRERYTVMTPISSILPIVSRFEGGEWVVWSLHSEQGRGKAYVVNAFLDGSNLQIQEWAYFNYWIYSLVENAAGRQPASFAAYPGSPVPHEAERVILIGILVGLMALSGGAFVVVRRYSLKHPEALDRLVSRQSVYDERQASTEWEDVGFHRPLGGFMLALMIGLILFIPLIIYQSLILPVYILPSAQALGIWGRVTQFFNLLWTFFDMGTSLAFVKFFSQYRVKDPRKAVQYGQVYVWWQALSGAVQVAMVVLIASVYVPETAYALYSWSIIIHTFIQIPGFYTVMKLAFRGWQRFDYATLLELGTGLIFPMVTQPALVIVMVSWGRSQVAFGQVMGGLIGLGLAAYATEALTFLLGLFLYHRLGYNTRVLFLAHFSWATVKDSFRFGVFDMLGSVAWAGGQAIEILITQTRLVNYTEIWGNWVLAQNFVFGFNATAMLYDNLMPSISEAVSNNYRKLSQYYSAMAYKWGGLINGFLGAALLAVTDRFILGATGPEFARAAGYCIPLLIWGAFQYPSWVSDNVEIGSNRPYLKMLMVALEQVIRVALAFLLIAQFQIYALIIAYFAGLLTKGIVAYFVNSRLCYQQRFYVWQSLIAPLLAGGAHYVVLRWLTGFIWKGDQVTSMLIFLIAILFSFPMYAFFYGLVGGWDDATLEELHVAVGLSNFMRPMVWLFWKTNALGAKISPLHGRFPIDIRADAMLEARSLTDARVKLGNNVADTVETLPGD